MMFVYDRTVEDVSRAAALIAKIRNVTFGGLTAEEQAEWMAGMKAVQNYTDWSRQTENTKKIAAETLPALGYNNFLHTPIQDAGHDGMPTLADVNALEGNLAAIESCGLTMPTGWGDAKAWAAGTGPAYTDWNRWERNIALLEEMAERMSAVFIRSAQTTAYCGGVTFAIPYEKIRALDSDGKYLFDKDGASLYLSEG